MDHRVPTVGLVFALVCTALAAITLIALNEAFDGPSVTGTVGGEPYHLTATFVDTEALPTKQPVLVRGVQVGKVTDVSFDHQSSKATVTFTVDDRLEAVHDDATVTIGERTLLGDPYLNLDPGSARGGELDSGAKVRTLPSVDFDEAFDFLDRTGRRHVSSILDTFKRATASERSGTELNVTVGELARTVGELRDLTEALRGQEDEIAGFVSSASTVVGELGNREQALRRVVASGRAALAALASNTASLDQGMAELPGVLAGGTEALRDAEPLLREARPLVRDLRKAAPELAPALADIGPLASDTVETVQHVSGLPSLRKLLRLVILGGPTVPGLEASVRNLVPLLQYAAPRVKGIDSFFSNFAGVTSHGDSDGAWARFAIMFVPDEVDDLPSGSSCLEGDAPPSPTGVCHNSYPEPGDAADPQPFEPGSYPRLKPYEPPPPK
jgi:phospholipid/cholesterol/gamma-HCH transport system substrate-binding protein